MASATVRSIIDADYKVDRSAETITYSLKPHKVFVFDHETEERVYFGNQTAPDDFIIDDVTGEKIYFNPPKDEELVPEEEAVETVEETPAETVEETAEEN
jgi:hypothetical protein